MSDFNFVGPAYLGRSTASESEKLINWYLEPGGPHAKSPISMVPTPGSKLFATLVGASRGMHVVGSVMYVASVGRLYSVDTNGVVTELGTLETTGGRVSFDDNGLQVMLVDGTSGYTFTIAGSTFAKITDADFPANPTHVTFMDGFFFITLASSKKIYKSDLSDGTSWNALAFKSAESSPDNAVTIRAFRNELWVFGETSTEPWYGNTSGIFPYAVRGNAVLDVGTIAQWSVSEMDNSLFFLGQSERGEKIVFRTQGYQKSRISTHAIEFALDSYSTISDAFGFCYIEEGHSFYALTFPTAGVTWVYDASIPDPQMAWHQRSSDDGRWFVDGYVYFNSDHYVSDYRNGTISKLSHHALDENGAAIKRTRTCPHVHNDREEVYINSLEIVFKTGAGTATGQGANPQAMLRVSKDGGRTWGNGMWRDIGKIGEYLTRTKWNMLGMSRDWVFELTVTDPIDCEVVSATIK